ncbi:prepilin peptidase [Ralstonia pseudosolanacearum]|uniref:A24 family peptidase n=1 Tax=Ralstonia pseudosolanacearum TaxID=1310165 RepID=UPI001FF95F09|nr:prepilin peptidase [Ralstonia pseudosolanacearum]
MSTPTALANLSLLVLVVTAAVHDVRTRRIPNRLVAAGLAAALIAQCAMLGPVAGALAWLGGAAVGMGLCIGLYLLHGMGAGDVKLMGAIGAFTGPLAALHVGLASCVAGGVLAVAMIALDARKNMGMALLFSAPVADRQTQPKEGVRRGNAIRLPYAVAFAAGTLLVKWGVL